MDKVTAFLEKNVEWVAMGLGGLFLLFVAWTFGINNPVPIEVAGEVYSPGNVDEKVAEVASQLETKLADKRVPKIAVANVADQFYSAFNAQNPGPDVRMAAGTEPKPVRGDAPAVAQVTNVNNQQAFVGKVERLPIVPATKLEEVRSGESFVAKPEPREVAENPEAAMEGVGRLPQRVAPIPAVQNDGVAQPPGMDRRWVTVFGKFNDAQLTKHFEEAKIPPFLQGHVYIEVQLERREVKGPNSFGEPEPVKGLPQNELGVPRNHPVEFIQLAVEPMNMQTILQPSFYQVLAGTRWEVPGQPMLVDDPNATPAGQFLTPDGKFDAAAALAYWQGLTTPAEQNKFRDSLPADQRRMLAGAIAKQKEEERRQNRPQNPGGTGGRSDINNRGGRPLPQPRGPGREYDAQDPSILQEMYAQADGRRLTPGELAQERILQRRGMMNRGNPGLMARENAGAEVPMVQQQGEFGLNPDGTIDVWQHDENAEPGKTYQYRIRVVIKNPLYGTNNIAADPKLAEHPYLLDPAVAPWSEWSKPVVIPPDLKMQFVHGGLSDKNSIRVNIRKFKDGKYQITPQPIMVEPGDIVGAKVGDVDFTTAWTLVDVRRIGNDMRVRLIDKDGNTMVRSTRADQADQDFRPVAPVTPDAVGGANGALINPIR